MQTGPPRRRCSLNFSTAGRVRPVLAGSTGLEGCDTRDLEYPVIWILTFADGKTVFPVPEGLAVSIPLLSTDGWPTEPTELEEPFVPTAISPKCWTELGSAEVSAQPGKSGTVNQLHAAAQALGVDSGPAAAMRSLAHVCRKTFPRKGRGCSKGARWSDSCIRRKPWDLRSCTSETIWH